MDTTLELKGRRGWNAQGRATRRGLWLTSAAMCIALGTPAFAQTSTATDRKPAEIDELVVTARKREESVQDIPASVSAISSATIQQQHITQIDDIATLVSNLHMVQRNDNSPDVTLRGVGSFGVVQGVGFYVNDVQLFEGQIMRPEDIERIEILKGPQGTLYGGANIGGAIKYVSKEPTDTWSGQVTGELGSFSARNVSGVRQ